MLSNRQVNIFPVRLNDVDLHNKKISSKPIVIWFTGISGSGKTSLSIMLQKYLNEHHILNTVLDGDNLRSGINSDLDFSEKGRNENLRRISHISKLFYENGFFTIVATISPFKKNRLQARKLFEEGAFCEVFLDANIDTCIMRGKSDLYKKAQMGKVKNFTGISSNYKKPKNPELVLDTNSKKPKESLKEIINFLKLKKIL